MFIDSQLHISLTDNQGSQYYRLAVIEGDERYGGTRIVYPNQAIQVPLYFVKPSPNSETLIVSTPKAYFKFGEANPYAGAEGASVEMAFPVTSISRRPPAQVVALKVGEAHQGEALTFEVLQVSQSSLDSSSEGQAVITVFYEVVNTSQTRKFDNADRIPQMLESQLTDGFGNRYKQYTSAEKTDDFGTRPTSMYPGGRYQGEVHFEPPIEEAKELILMINASKLGFLHEMRVEIPRESIQRQEK